MDSIIFPEGERQSATSFWRKVMARRGIAPRVTLSTSSAPLRLSAPRGKKILIVDDDAVLVKALSLKLNAEGYEALQAIDPSEAISVVRDSKPDLILLDLNFPPDISSPGAVVWDGLRLLKWLRFVEARVLPVIIVTGSDAAEFRNACLASGAVGFFQKPFQPASVLAAIERVFQSHDTRTDRPRGDYQI